MARNILITGCSSGGKSTLIDALEALGFAVIHEPGLRVIREGGPKPWEDLPGFVEAVTRLSREDLHRAKDKDGIVFFDRGLFDAVSGRAEGEERPLSELMPSPFPFAEPVFYAPPWPEIFENTPDRKLPFEAAEKEAIRLRRDLGQLGIRSIELPRMSVEKRVQIVLGELDLH